jgi:Bax protein
MKTKIILYSVGLLMTTSLVHANDIHPNKNTKHYEASVVPKHMTVQEKKERFFALLVPAIDQVYNELNHQYVETKKLIKVNPKSEKLQILMKTYSATSLSDLLTRIKPHPRSIAIAQSAMESAWGTSRFFRVAKNVFGVWSFNKNEPRIPASKKRGNKTIYVKKYSTIADSIRDNYKILATGKIFQEFRNAKMKTDNPYKLVNFLTKYSERGKEYNKELANMIRHNKLTKYDK